MINVIGGGIGGLSLGVGLAKKGLNFQIFEQAPEVKPVGAGIMMASNAMQIYKKWGLDEAILARGQAVHELRITDEKFRTLSRTDLRPYAQKYGVDQVAIHRAELLRLLSEAAGLDRLHLGHTLAAVRQDKAVHCTFEGGQVHTADWLVGADGIHSKVRNELGITQTLRSSGQQCWRGVCSFDLPKTYRQVGLEAWGPGKRFGFTGIGNAQVYWYAVADMSFETMNFDDFPPLVNALIAQTNHIHRSELLDISPFRGWSSGNCALLGDAAHATTPNMGQGACQAVEDAYVLSECFERHPEAPFAPYEALRYRKAHDIVRKSRTIGQVSHIHSPLIRGIRNGIMRRITSTAPFDALFALKYPF